MSTLLQKANAIKAQKDTYLLPENLKSGVTCLGVTGTMEGEKPTQTKTVDPSTSQQVVVPDTGYDLSQVTVNAVTSSIDANITAGNIKSGVSILGVTGTCEYVQQYRFNVSPYPFEMGLIRSNSNNFINGSPDSSGGSYFTIKVVPNGSTCDFGIRFEDGMGSFAQTFSSNTSTTLSLNKSSLTEKEPTGELPSVNTYAPGDWIDMWQYLEAVRNYMGEEYDDITLYIVRESGEEEEIDGTIPADATPMDTIKMVARMRYQSPSTPGDFCPDITMTGEIS